MTNAMHLILRVDPGNIGKPGVVYDVISQVHLHRLKIIFLDLEINSLI